MWYNIFLKGMKNKLNLPAVKGEASDIRKTERGHPLAMAVNHKFLT